MTFVFRELRFHCWLLAVAWLTAGSGICAGQLPDSFCRITVADGTAGSGTLIEKNDYSATVVTCSHLFDQSTSGIIVKFHDGSRYAAKLIGRDTGQDLAALKIRAPQQSPTPVSPDAPSGTLTACGWGGDEVLKCAQGPISGYAQAIGASYPSTKIAGVVRPGDSGGGVLDEQGRLAGVIWGCRDGETYASCGVPLQQFCQSCVGDSCYGGGWQPATRPNRLVIQPQQPQQPKPASYTDPQWVEWRKQIESQLAAIKPCQCKDCVSREEYNALLAKFESTQQTVNQINNTVSTQQPVEAYVPPSPEKLAEQVAPHLKHSATITLLDGTKKTQTKPLSVPLDFTQRKVGVK